MQYFFLESFGHFEGKVSSKKKSVKKKERKYGICASRKKETEGDREGRGLSRRGKATGVAMLNAHLVYMIYAVLVQIAN